MTKKMWPKARFIASVRELPRGVFPICGIAKAWGTYLLLAITARKVAHRHRHDLQQRRDVRRDASDSIFVCRNEDRAPGGIDNLPSREPTAEFAAEFVETCETLFSSLDDPALQQVVSLRMEGYTDGEIGDRLKCSRRTVQRRLEVIRRHWDRLGLSSE
jgi:DNA-directed RNA polymerase specialized sigma24 family protein